MSQGGFGAYSEAKLVSQFLQKNFKCDKMSQNSTVFSVSYSSDCVLSSNFHQFQFYHFPGDWFILYQMSKNLNQRFFAEFITVLALTVNPDPNIEPEEPEIYLTEEDLERRRNGPASRASSESSDSSENSGGGGSGDGEEGMYHSVEMS